ncbi:FimV family protein [Thiomonas sp. FB-Cd]|uniref:type IV pilus assembly protein FimV n=1 Tax=Thiomonas sp. FB-Cd TaxID=1158292 RepID=UPI0004DEE55A|nr:FimV/HubP family polar landmark protein [Thiomonas sp. FB-Cd]
MNPATHPLGRSLVAALLTLSFGSAHALTLGPIRVLSHLGQPLSARIPVLSLSDPEGQTLLAQMASPYAYRQAGLQADPVLPFIRVTLANDRQGHPYIHLATQRPVWSPYLDLMITLAWQETLPQGPTLHLSRDYTILLDPPTEGVAPLQESGASTQHDAPPDASGANQDAATSSAKPLPAQAMPVAPAKAVPASVQPLTVRRGDTLWGVAHRLAGSNESMTTKMADAIWRSNPQAFVAHDPNLLRVGSHLRIPDAAQVRAATPLPERPTRPFEGRAQIASGQGQPVKDAPVLRMSDAIFDIHAAPPAPALTTAAASTADLAHRLALAKAQVRQAEIAYEQAQARLQALRAQGGASKPMAATAMTASPVAVATRTPKQANQQRGADVPHPQPHAPAQPRSLLWRWLAGAALLATAIMLLWLDWRRRARKQPASWAPIPPGAHALDADPRKLFGSPISPARMLETERNLAQLQTAPGPQVQPPSDVWEPLEPTTIATDDEPDPLTEAEFYVLHDRPHQALELLRDAVARHPEHVPAHLKILEILGSLHDHVGFEEYAKGLRDRFGPDVSSKIQMLQDRLTVPASARNGAPDSGKAPQSISQPRPGAGRATDSLPALDLDLSSDFLGTAPHPDPQ